MNEKVAKPSRFWPESKKQRTEREEAELKVKVEKLLVEVVGWVEKWTLLDIKAQEKNAIAFQYVKRERYSALELIKRFHRLLDESVTRTYGLYCFQGSDAFRAYCSAVNANPVGLGRNLLYKNKRIIELTGRIIEEARQRPVSERDVLVHALQELPYELRTPYREDVTETEMRKSWVRNYD